MCIDSFLDDFRCIAARYYVSTDDWYRLRCLESEREGTSLASMACEKVAISRRSGQPFDIDYESVAIRLSSLHGCEELD
jgi:hypothetical protein